MSMPLQIPQNPIIINNMAPYTTSQSLGKSVNNRETKRELARRMRIRIQQEREEHDILNIKPCADPEKESVRKNIQQRIRMRMIRKGHIPPNPTLEELQMCGLQPISMPFDYQQQQQTQAYFQQPIMLAQPAFSSYQQSQQTILPQPGYGLSGNSTQVTSPITMQPIPHSSNYQPVLMKPSTCKPIFPKCPAVDSLQPILKRPIYDCHAYFEHPTEVKECHPEPFMLPEREEYSPNTFESFFGGDFVLEKYQ
jgi:hypothetical protein